MEGTENMSDESFEIRHQRLEKNEKKRKRYVIKLFIYCISDVEFN